MSVGARDTPWGDPWVSVHGEPIVPDFKTNREFLAWCKKLTREQKAMAKIRCQQDRAYFIHNFVWFRAKPEDPDMAKVMPVGWIQFRLWPAQLEVLRDIAEWSLIFCIKVRQFGLTWLWSAMGLHQSIFYSDQAGFVFSYDQRLANKLLRRIKNIWEKLPDFLIEDSAEEGDRWSDEVISFSNGSVIEAFATTLSANVGDAYSWGIFDEFCLVETLAKKDLSEMVESSMLTTLEQHNGWFVANSSGRYRAGWSWKQACKIFPELGGKQNAKPEYWEDWRGVFIPITKHPYWQGELGEKRIAQALKRRDPRIFWREHPRNIQEAFAIGGQSVFEPDHLQRHLTPIRAGLTPSRRNVTFRQRGRGAYVPDDTRDGQNESRLYVESIRGHTYLLALDPTRQKASKDFCGGVVLDVTTGETSCVIHWKFSDAIEFADYAIMVGSYYNDALLIPEVNVDRGLVRRLVERDYLNLYRREQSGDTPAPFDQPMEDQVGFLLNPGSGAGSRTKVLARAKYEVRSNWVRIYDEELISEMSTFIVTVSPDGKREKEEAASGAHDDLLMPFSIGVYVAREQPEYVQDNYSENVDGTTVEDVLNDGRPPRRRYDDGDEDVVWDVDAPGVEAADPWENAMRWIQGA